MLKNIKYWIIAALLVITLTSTEIQAATIERDITDFSEFVDSFKAQLRYIDDSAIAFKDYIGGEFMYVMLIELEILIALVNQRNPELHFRSPQSSLRDKFTMVFKAVLYKIPLDILKALYRSFISNKNYLYDGCTLTKQEIKALTLKALALKKQAEDILEEVALRENDYC